MVPRRRAAGTNRRSTGAMSEPPRTTSEPGRALSEPVRTSMTELAVYTVLGGIVAAVLLIVADQSYILAAGAVGSSLGLVALLVAVSRRAPSPQPSHSPRAHQVPPSQTHPTPPSQARLTSEQHHTPDPPAPDPHPAPTSAGGGRRRRRHAR